MKTKLLRESWAPLAAALIAAAALPVHAEDNPTFAERNYTGTVSAVNANDKALTVHGWFLSKRFVLGDNCALSAAGRRDVTLADFRPGQKVSIAYKDANGVYIADRINGEKLLYAGEVVGMDRSKHTMTVRAGNMSRTFLLADNCELRIRGNDKGSLDDIKLGNRVTVTYETPRNQWLARQIEQKGATYVGALGAINLPERTVSADKRFLGPKRFHIADDCAVVTNGKLGGRLTDLRPGMNYELSYETVDGVNIVNRIAPAPVTQGEKVEASAQNRNNSTAALMKDY